VPEDRHLYTFAWCGGFSGLGGCWSGFLSVGRTLGALPASWARCDRCFVPRWRGPSRCASGRYPSAVTYRDGLRVTLRVWYYSRREGAIP